MDAPGVVLLSHSVFKAMQSLVLENIRCDYQEPSRYTNHRCESFMSIYNRTKKCIPFCTDETRCTEKRGNSSSHFLSNSMPERTIKYFIRMRQQYKGQTQIYLHGGRPRMSCLSWMGYGAKVKLKICIDIRDPHFLWRGTPKRQQIKQHAQNKSTNS